MPRACSTASSGRDSAVRSATGVGRQDRRRRRRWQADGTLCLATTFSFFARGGRGRRSGVESRVGWHGPLVSPRPLALRPCQRDPRLRNPRPLHANGRPSPSFVLAAAASSRLESPCRCVADSAARSVVGGDHRRVDVGDARTVAGPPRGGPPPLSSSPKLSAGSRQRGSGHAASTYRRGFWGVPPLAADESADRQRWPSADRALAADRRRDVREAQPLPPRLGAPPPPPRSPARAADDQAAAPRLRHRCRPPLAPRRVRETVRRAGH